ncbi:orotidine 5-phosphate decarboxylase [Roseovarius mucosus]|uniref:orotidine 5-phosphate decarboxylase n=1 Tax=Roseovarius mucosus TaxID=215743 RepID=UPI001C5E6EA5|nr:orotidine 5-phosphate decarboxylase [Roseovarius mucosus]MBW4973252.1 orotidine 5-phosphate decarboxylase [Roseovarius mucosus]
MPQIAITFALILGLVGGAEAQTALSERVSLAHGTFSNGGGLTIATELRPTTDGRTALCGVWSESESQSSYTKGAARELVRLATVYVDGQRIAQNLVELPQIDPRLDYAGAPAGCILTTLSWQPGRVPEVFMPRKQISRSSGGGSGPQIDFAQTGTGAMSAALEVIPLLVRNSRTLPLSSASQVIEGRYSSGGGLRLAAELRPINGRAHLCGVWSDLPGQDAQTEGLGREILRRSHVMQSGQEIARDLGNLRRVSARGDYTGAEASCLDLKQPWRAEQAEVPLTLHLPDTVVYRSTTPKGQTVIRFGA